MTPRISQWAFSVLLALYPAELRRDFGVEMQRAFRDQTQAAARQGGRWAVLRLWPTIVSDALRTIVMHRRDQRRSSLGAPPGRPSSPTPAPRERIMESVLADVRHGVRSFFANPGFAAAATLTLALGVGASVTMFSGLSNFILDPLPFADQDDLYMVWSVIPERGVDELSLSYDDFVDLRGSDALERMAAWYASGHNLTGGDEPARIEVLRTSADVFPILLAEAQAGRVFSAAEEAAGESVIVLSHGLWERQFAGDPEVVGKTLRLDGEPHVVVGVMPADFWFPTPQYDAWLPLDLAAAGLPRNARFLGAVGTVAEGTSPGQAEVALSATAETLAGEYPDTNEGVTGVNLSPLVTEVVGDEMRYSLYALNITGIAVLLIACVNIANLLIARGLARRREIAVRTALGAGRARLVRQSLAENLVLGLAGGGLGALVAKFGIDGIAAALSANEPGRVPRLAEYIQSGFDGRVVGFTVLASLGGVLLFGLIPALHSTRGNLLGGLQDGARGLGAGVGGAKLQKSLVVVEMALTIGLLIGAGLAVRSFAVVQQTDPGMDRDGLLTLSVSLAASDYPDDEGTTAFFDRTLAEFAGLPGIEGAAATTSVPAARQGSFRSFEVEGRAADREGDLPRANAVTVSPDYFDVLRTPIVRGRGLSDADNALSAPVVLINQSAADFYWPEGNPIGGRIRAAGSDGAWLEIVGVVGDLKNNGLHRPTWPAVYRPLAQSPARDINLVVRTTGDAAEVTGSLRSALASIDDSVPMYRVMTMQRVYENRFWGETLTMKLLVWCALGALLLSVVGIYGVISHSVTQRSHEMGVRIALGAQPGSVAGLVVRQGLWLVSGGLAFGLVLGFGLSRGLSFMLFGVDPNDPTTYVAVVTFVTAVAVLASYVPARRATRVDPVVALRED